MRLLSENVIRMDCSANSQRSAALLSGCGYTLPEFLSLPGKGNGAPGGARALRYRALARPLRSGRVRADQAGLARPGPRRARPAATSLRGSPPGRCASRRSTGLARVAPLKPRCGLPDLRPRFPARPDPTRVMTARRNPERGRAECKAGSESGDKLFSDRTVNSMRVPSSPRESH
jgi:hypothetical protein